MRLRLIIMLLRHQCWRQHRDPILKEGIHSPHQITSLALIGALLKTVFGLRLLIFCTGKIRCHKETLIRS